MKSLTTHLVFPQDAFIDLQMHTTYSDGTWKPEQIVMYLEYAEKHHLLTSSGSDSHGPEKKPIKYQAKLSRRLLERVGIQVQERSL